MSHFFDSIIQIYSQKIDVIHEHYSCLFITQDVERVQYAVHYYSIETGRAQVRGRGGRTGARS